MNIKSIKINELKAFMADVFTVKLKYKFNLVTKYTITFILKIIS